MCPLTPKASPACNHPKQARPHLKTPYGKGSLLLHPMRQNSCHNHLSTEGGWAKQLHSNHEVHLPTSEMNWALVVAWRNLQAKRASSRQKFTHPSQKANPSQPANPWEKELHQPLTQEVRASNVKKLKDIIFCAPKVAPIIGEPRHPSLPPSPATLAAPLFV